MRGLRLLYLALGASTATLNPFLVVILAEHGLDSAVIGVVIALSAASLFGASPVWGHVGDVILGRRKTLLAAGTIASAVALAIAAPVPNLVLAALVIVFTLSQGACLGLCDSLAVAALPDPHRQYGQIRMMASLSFGFVSIPLGFLYNRTGYAMASVFFVLAIAAIAVSLIFVPDHRPSREIREPAREAALADGPTIRHGSRLGSAGLAFKLQPRLPGVLASVLLVWFAVAVSFSFLSLRIVDLGGHASDVAMSFGVSAFAEIPGMLLAARLAARLGLRGLFMVGAFGYALAFASWTTLDTPAQIVASRVLTGVAYGGLTVAMVLTMGEILPSSLQATGQTLYQATATGLASVAGNAIAGQLYQSAGASFLFGLCAAVMAAGGLLGWATLPARVRRVAVPAEIEELVVPRSPLV